MKRRTLKLFALIAIIYPIYAQATKTVTIELLNANGKPQPIGTVTFEGCAYGLLIKPDLKNLPPGIHGFHVHENPSCAKNGMAAGGHLDLAKTNKHLGPYDDFGHLGDMPVLIVDKNGTATLTLLAPRLHEYDIEKRSVMIHAGGDNYSDNPKMGGGGERIACGVVE